MPTAERDQLAEELARLVGHLALARDRGRKEGKSLLEQKAYREGISTAMRLMASSALLMTIGPESASLIE